ncbi:MAG TPA: phosphotransferase [Nocardioidaceae bacterium]|nr:phosphotransferase [Nocardioidaceae bacterium]
MAGGTVTVGGTVDVSAALSGEDALQGVRDLALRPSPYGVAGLLSECVNGDPSAWRLDLLRTKFKPSRKLSAYYRLPSAGGGRSIAVTWSAEPAASRAEADELEDDARARGLLAPFSHLTAMSDDGRINLLISPADPVLPQLVRTSQESYLEGMVAALAGPLQLRSPAAMTVRTIRYRPGQRHVLAISTTHDGDTVAFVKLDRDDCGERAVRIAEIVGPQLAASCRGASMVKPWGYSAADRASVWKPAPGMVLWQRAEQWGVTSVARSVALVGRALRVLHDSGPDTDAARVVAEEGLLAHRTVAGEASATVRAGEHIDVLLPSSGATYRAVVADVLVRLGSLDSEVPGFIHGDAKGDNIMVDDDGICLLDLDRFSSGEPALDLGKFLADLRWWCRALGLDEAVLAAAFVDGYGGRCHLRWERASLIAVLFSLKLAARRGAVHDPAWASQTTRAIAEAAARLDAEPVP